MQLPSVRDFGRSCKQLSMNCGKGNWRRVPEARTQRLVLWQVLTLCIILAVSNIAVFPGKFDALKDRSTDNDL